MRKFKKCRDSADKFVKETDEAVDCHGTYLESCVSDDDRFSWIRHKSDG
jgi:hypothetical protein